MSGRKKENEIKRQNWFELESDSQVFQYRWRTFFSYGKCNSSMHFCMDGLNCHPMTFDPSDATECGLTGEKAQGLCREFAEKTFLVTKH